MMTVKWRIILSTLNLASAILLSVLGARQDQAFSQMHPFARYEGNFVYIPPAQVVSGCVNAPAFVFSNLLGNIRGWRSFRAERALGGAAFGDVDVTYYVLLFVFWWWIGWRIDLRARHNSRTTLAALFWLAGSLLALTLAYAGAHILHISESSSSSVSGQRAISISMFCWGLILSCYCGRMLSRFWRSS
jgi:hypothetical protein